MATAQGAVRAAGRPNKHTQMPDGFGLYTPEQAAQLLNPDIITASWLREKARKREIEFTMMAGKVAFTVSQLAALVEKGRVAPGTVERQATEPRRRRVREAIASAPAVTPLRARPPRRRRSA